MIAFINETQEPKPYEFAYAVEDDKYGPQFSQREQSDGNAVQGSYVVQLPDGRKQTVRTTARRCLDTNYRWRIGSKRTVVDNFNTHFYLGCKINGLHYE